MTTAARLLYPPKIEIVNITYNRKMAGEVGGTYLLIREKILTTFVGNLL